MARVNSKYFADIIAKFLESKRKENIIIDESFRDDLRMKVMARAAEISQGAGIVNEVREARDLTARDDVRAEAVKSDLDSLDHREELPDRAPIDWFGFLRRFRYVLALVPSALLVVLVSSYVMNMPVKVGSDVVVPRANDVSTEQNVTENGVKPLFTEGETREDSSDATREEIPEVSSGDAVTSEQSVENVENVSGVNTQSEETSAEPSVQPQVSDQPVSVSPVQPSNEVQSQLPSQPLTQPLSQPEEFTQQVPEYMDTYNRMNVPSAPASAFVPFVKPTQPSINEVQPSTGGVEEVSEPVEDSSVTAPTQYVPVVPTRKTMPVEDNNVSNLSVPAEIKSAPVYYYTNLSDIQKNNLEDQIENTVDQTDVSEMYVYSLSGDVVEVVVRYKDGTAVTKNLRKVGDTGAFDDVSSSVGEQKAAQEPVVIPSEVLENEGSVPTYIPPSIPSGYYGPVEYEVLLDYDRVTK